ncbi:VOC family protein [Marinobacter sp.]|uniref:VOC family protein n=1 Tax=Marinobacter sp. TaxID=50741 RepID=UPI0035682AFC
MSIYLRQICLVAEELAPVVEQIENLFGVPVCHRDPEVATFGLENALFAFGSQFLEVVAPIREGTAAGRFLERRGGPGGYMVICQATSLEEQAGVRARAAENNVRVVWESDHQSGNIMQLHPRDMGAAFLEVDWDEQADPQGNWQPAGGMDWVKHTMTDRVSGITGITLSHTKPTQLARHWSDVMGMPVKDRDGMPAIETPNTVLKFAECDHEDAAGLTAIDVAVGDPATILTRSMEQGAELTGHSLNLCGVEFLLR